MSDQVKPSLCEGSWLGQSATLAQMIFSDTSNHVESVGQGVTCDESDEGIAAVSVCLDSGLSSTVNHIEDPY